MNKLLRAAVITLVIFGGCFFYYTSNDINDSISVREVDEIPVQISGAKKEGLIPGGYIQGTVVKIVDGDTINVNYKRRIIKVRLLDIDAPESVDRGIPVQVYSKEAAEIVKKISLNKEVKLVFEKGLRDKYGRLLAYVILKDGVFLNALLIRNGFARVEIVLPNNALAGYFYRLQDIAIKDKVGLWGLPEDKQPFVRGSKGDYIPKYRINQKAY